MRDRRRRAAKLLGSVAAVAALSAGAWVMAGTAASATVAPLARIEQVGLPYAFCQNKHGSGIYGPSVALRRPTSCRGITTYSSGGKLRVASLDLAEWSSWGKKKAFGRADLKARHLIVPGRYRVRLDRPRWAFDPTDDSTKVRHYTGVSVKIDSKWRRIPTWLGQAG